MFTRWFPFFQVLKISLLGHRKRIIASLAERPYEEPPVKPPRLSQIRVRTCRPLPFLSTHFKMTCLLRRDESVPPLRLGFVSFFVFSPKFLQVRAKNEGQTWNITHCVSLLSLQCQDLPGSQSSSPLSQMESYTGRSMDLLLPAGEAGRKKVRDTDYDVSQRHHSERHRSHVSLSSSVFLQHCLYN